MDRGLALPSVVARIVVADHPPHREVHAPHVLRGEERMVGRIGGEQRQVRAGRAAAEHDAVRIDAVAAGIALEPGERALHVTLHARHVVSGIRR